MNRLAEIDRQCVGTLAATPANAVLIEENLRGYVMALSAHFQGFCRDLNTEAAGIIASKVRTSLQLLIQEQFTAHRKLDRGNPNLLNIKTDFMRFGFKVELDRDPANVPRLMHLSDMNKWRNVAAHQGTVLPTGIPLNLPTIQSWVVSSDGLATSLDDIVYNHLRKILKRTPW